MFRIVAGAVSFVALFAAVTRAESPKPKTLGQQHGFPTTRAWLESLDRDRDGVVTRREFAGTDTQFRTLDTDDDGKLTLTKSDPARGEPVRDDKRDTRGDKRITDSRDDKRDSRDDKRDNRVTDSRRDPIAPVTNPDGRTIGERHGYPTTRDWLATMDRDNDGVITRREFTGTRTEFDILDVNSDGKLTLGRKPAKPVMQPTRPTNARSPLR